MVSRLHPLNVKLNFQDNTYHLGDTVDITVSIQPMADVEIREARIDLICEEEYTEHYRVMMTTNPAGIIAPGPAVSVPKDVVKEHKETCVHSGVLFLENYRTKHGASEEFNVQLWINDEPPPNSERSTVNWTLVTTIDVAGAVDTHSRTPINIPLP